ncbi:hypothetical protein C5C66_08075 [Rathayibacter toxicus]|uniref:HIRAN domain-containing protein n=1 Tax=Rathayibacter toxicus TaxID=145458 RepID=A0A2S5Y693_9MICO|nr:hypothetical protein APU90_08855 [Rathayibacter toxicus]PPG20464.1 hypothetical protein C5D15_08070 [Rathayibacter toxicus]PPG45566.1 hypothetical protein C5D16_08040 [Rathayibacter toxicus]PPH22667.1 hypothetical protein C5D17_08080 [Rathayibacter toxicus]PPH56869.1 hypothetical protein C5D30_08070 [Rathayibacter toxicus]
MRAGIADPERMPSIAVHRSRSPGGAPHLDSDLPPSQGARRPDRFPTTATSGLRLRPRRPDRSRGRSGGSGEVSEHALSLDLVPEPDHPSGAPAVSVRADGRVIGYLPDSYRSALDRVVASGAAPTTRGRLRVERTKTGLRATLRLALVPPEVLVPANDPPEEPYSLLPWARGVQVLRKDEHFVRLAGVVPPDGRGLLLVTLHLVGARVEGRLDGSRVGELSAPMSEQFVPTLRHLSGLRLLAAAYCVVTGSPLKAELTLQAPKAAELPAGWVDGAPVTLPRLVAVVAVLVGLSSWIVDALLN